MLATYIHIIITKSFLNHTYLKEKSLLYIAVVRITSYNVCISINVNQSICMIAWMLDGYNVYYILSCTCNVTAIGDTILYNGTQLQ